MTALSLQLHHLPPAQTPTLHFLPAPTLAALHRAHSPSDEVMNEETRINNTCKGALQVEKERPRSVEEEEEVILRKKP